MLELDKIRYTPAANFNGSDSFTYEVCDDGTTNGGPDPLCSLVTATVNVTVTSVNDAPSGADNTITIAEDTSHTFVAADFGFSDPNDSPADDLLSVQITTLPLAGSLTLDGNPVAAGDDISVADINAGLLVFSPAADDNGLGYASFGFKVRDDGGTADGGINLDPSADTITIDVTEVNDNPVAADDTATVLEDSSVAIDVLANDSAGPANESTQTLTIGTIGTPANGTAVLELDKIRYTPAANFNGSDSFTYEVCDDGTTNGGPDPLCSLVTATVNVTVTSVNDAPSGADNTITIAEDTSHTFVAADFGFSDPNDSPADDLLSVQITTLPLAGSLTLDGNPVAAGDDISVADINAGLLVFSPAADDNGLGYASFGFKVRDDGGTADGGINLDPSADTITIDVTEVNDNPVAADDTATVLEDSSVAIDVLANDRLVRPTSRPRRSPSAPSARRPTAPRCSSWTRSATPRPPTSTAPTASPTRSATTAPPTVGRIRCAPWSPPPST